MVVSKLQTISLRIGSMSGAIAVVGAFERLRGTFPYLTLPAEHVGQNTESALAVLEEHGLVDHREEYVDSLDRVVGWYELTPEGRDLLRELLRS